MRTQTHTHACARAQTLAHTQCREKGAITDQNAVWKEEFLDHFWRQGEAYNEEQKGENSRFVKQRKRRSSFKGEMRKVLPSEENRRDQEGT